MLTEERGGIIGAVGMRENVGRVWCLPRPSMVFGLTVAAATAIASRYTSMHLLISGFALLVWVASSPMAAALGSLTVVVSDAELVMRTRGRVTRLAKQDVGFVNFLVLEGPRAAIGRVQVIGPHRGIEFDAKVLWFGAYRMRRVLKRYGYPWALARYRETEFRRIDAGFHLPEWAESALRSRGPRTIGY